MSEVQVRLRSAHDIYPASDGAWRVSSPGDRFDRIELPFALAATVARILTGREESGDWGPEMAAIIDAFVDAGYAESRAQPVRRATSVCCFGDASYLTLVTDLLQKAGATVTPAPGADGIWLFGQLNLDDEQMVRWDAWAEEAGVVRHRAFFEGGRWFIGPMTEPGRTATYADYRLRRLAACDVPNELAEYWRALPALCQREPSAGVAALIAGFLVGDVLAVLGGSRPPTAGFQIELDPETLQTTWHPVLPLPGGLWEGE